MSFQVIYFLNNDFSATNTDMIRRWSSYLPIKVAYEGDHLKFVKLKEITQLNATDIAQVKWELNSKLRSAKKTIRKFPWFHLNSLTLPVLRILKAIELLHVQSRHVWTIEKDVAFIGNPTIFFDSFTNSQADLISSRFSYVDDRYWAFKPRTLLSNAMYKPHEWPWNTEKMSSTDVVIWRAVMVERYSLQLLNFVRNLTQHGLFMQAEIFESTVCYNEDWCQIEKWDVGTTWRSHYYVPNTKKARHHFPNCSIVSKCCKNQFVHPLPELKTNKNCSTLLR